MRFLGLVLMLLVLCTTAQAADFSVGVSPTILNIDASPGDQKVTKFGVFTVSDESLLVYFETSDSNMDFFNVGYKNYMPYFSEQPSGTWLDILQNPLEITVTDGKTAGRSWNNVSVLVNVPEDAEPGYHVAYITPKPVTFGTVEAPVGASIVSVSNIPILIKVAGDARREGTILDTTAHDYTGNSVKLRTFFHNTGTVTLYARTINRVFDINNSLVGEFNSPYERVKPQSTSQFETAVNSRINPGQYTISSAVDFTTGRATKDSVINLQPGVFFAAEPSQEFPWFIVILIIAIAIIIIAVRWLSAKRF